MAYIDELLGRGEHVLYATRQHLFVLVSHVVTELIVIGLLIAAAVVSRQAFAHNSTPIVADIPASTFIPLACGILSLFVLISGFLDYLRWNTEQYLVTDQRVIQVRGILSKRVIDSSLSKINDVVFRQSLLGRILNFGTIEILTATDELNNTMDRIAAPLEFKRAMLEARHNYVRGYSYSIQSSPMSATDHGGYHTGDIQSTLTELAALRDRGILSPDEFEAKKRELLSRI